MILSCFYLYVVRCLVMSDMTMSPCLSYLHFRLDLLYSYSHVSQICTLRKFEKHMSNREKTTHTHTQTLKVFKGLIRFHVQNDTFILLMEEILHHLGYINLVNNGINYIHYQLVQDFFHQQYHWKMLVSVEPSLPVFFYLRFIYIDANHAETEVTWDFFEPGDLWGGCIQIFVGCVYNENCGRWHIIYPPPKCSMYGFTRWKIAAFNGKRR